MSSSHQIQYPIPASAWPRQGRKGLCKTYSPHLLALVSVNCHALPTSPTMDSGIAGDREPAAANPPAAAAGDMDAAVEELNSSLTAMDWLSDAPATQAP